VGRFARLFVSLGALLLCCAAHAQTISWKSSAGSWTDSTKWDPQDVPDQLTDHAVFASPDANNADVTLGSPITIGTLTMSASQPQFTIQNIGSLSVGVTTVSSAGAQVTIQNGGLLNSTSFSTSATTTINAGGQLISTHYVQTSLSESTVSGTLNVSSGSIELSEGPLTGDGGVIRSGAITVSDQAQLLLRSGAELQTGSLANNGQLRLDNGRANATSTIQVSGSVIGSGTLSSTQLNDFAVLSPGSRSGPTVTTGDLHVTGDLAFGSTDTNFVADITSSSHDTVHVDGDADLSTFLIVPVAGSFVPATGSEFVILTADAIDISGIDYDHVSVNNQDRISVGNDDGEIGSFVLLDRLGGISGEELVLSDFRPVPEPGPVSLLLLMCVSLGMRRRSTL
jgi:hypothetical protein